MSEPKKPSKEKPPEIQEPVNPLQEKEDYLKGLIISGHLMTTQIFEKIFLFVHDNPAQFPDENSRKKKYIELLKDNYSKEHIANYWRDQFEPKKEPAIKERKIERKIEKYAGADALPREPEKKEDQDKTESKKNKKKK